MAKERRYTHNQEIAMWAVLDSINSSLRLGQIVGSPIRKVIELDLSPTVRALTELVAVRKKIRESVN